MGLFFAVFAVLGALGVWRRSIPSGSTDRSIPRFWRAPAQPDWFLGWLDGALRLFPAWEIRTGSFMIPNPFFPGVLLPGVTFGLLYLWPFLEARFTKDYGPHELLDRPTDQPARSAIGAGVLTFYIILLLSASNDVIARMFRVPVLDMTVAFRIAVFVIPLLVAFVVYRWFQGRKDRGSQRSDGSESFPGAASSPKARVMSTVEIFRRATADGAGNTAMNKWTSRATGPTGTEDSAMQTARIALSERFGDWSRPRLGGRWLCRPAVGDHPGDRRVEASSSRRR